MQTNDTILQKQTPHITATSQFFLQIYDIHNVQLVKVSATLVHHRSTENHKTLQWVERHITSNVFILDNDKTKHSFTHAYTALHFHN